MTDSQTVLLVLVSTIAQRWAAWDDARAEARGALYASK